jgi:hypothetical protein
MEALKRIIRESLPENKAQRGRCDSQAICDELGVDMDELVYILFHHMEKAIKSMYKYASEKDQLAYDNVYLRRALERKYQGNKRDVQAAKVSGGLPIAKNKRKDLMGLKLQMHFGLTDKQLMEYFQISKTTLWRWKKELAEREKNGQMPF